MPYTLRPSWLGYAFLCFYLVLILAIAGPGYLGTTMILAGIAEHGRSLLIVGLMFFAGGTWLATLFGPYLINSLTFHVRIAESVVSFREGPWSRRFESGTLSKLAFGLGGRGWRYVTFLPDHGDAGVISNSLYSDRSFDELSERLKEWMKSNGRSDMIVDATPTELAVAREFRSRGRLQYVIPYFVVVAIVTLGAWIVGGFHWPLPSFHFVSR